MSDSFQLPRTAPNKALQRTGCAGPLATAQADTPPIRGISYTTSCEKFCGIPPTNGLWIGLPSEASAEPVRSQLEKILTSPEFLRNELRSSGSGRAAVGLFRMGRTLTFPEFALLRCDPRVKGVTTHFASSSTGPAYYKAHLAASREAGEPNPFDVGEDGVADYFTVVQACASAAKLRAGGQ